MKKLLCILLFALFLGCAKGPGQIDDEFVDHRNDPPQNSDSRVPGADDKLGTSLAWIGDFNGDGVEDYAVGASQECTVDAFETIKAVGPGYVQIRSGDNDKILSTVRGDEKGDGFGFWRSLAALGDIDGDGLDDIAIGAPHLTCEAPWDSFEGSVTIVTKRRNYEFRGDAQESFGTGVLGLGDVDKDGTPDFAVGIPGPNFEGRVAVFSGARVPQGKDAALLTTLAVPGGRWFGLRMANAGDVNGDGLPELVISQLRYPADGVLGKLYLYLASEGSFSHEPLELPPQDPLPRPEGRKPWVFVEHVAQAGDVNGDGYGDIIVGARQESGPYTLVFLGDPNGVQLTPIRIGSPPDTNLPPDAFGGDFGASVARAGDLNCDGRDEILISDPRAYNYQGAVFIFRFDPPTASFQLYDTIVGNQGLIENGSPLFGIALAAHSADGFQHELLIGAPYFDNLAHSWDPLRNAGTYYHFTFFCPAAAN